MSKCDVVSDIKYKFFPSQNLYCNKYMTFCIDIGKYNVKYINLKLIFINEKKKKKL